MEKTFALRMGEKMIVVSGLADKHEALAITCATQKIKYSHVKKWIAYEIKDAEIEEHCDYIKRKKYEKLTLLSSIV